jgi:transcriptional/translational regulatory protein YebC/TACO1
VKDIGDGLILTEPDELNRVKNEVGKLGLKLVHAGIVMKIKNPVMLQSEDEVAAVLELVDSLEEHDDVVAVYTGFDYKDGT